ncbi:MAG: lysoplasmalogenase family protein [Treponema sp.]|nr:lysoplasmalogenase family protein [Treponema sp.]
MKKHCVVIIFSIILFVLFLVHEYFLFAHHEWRVLEAVLKGSLSLFPFILCFLGWKEDKSRLNILFLIAFCLCLIGDAVINLFMVFSAVCYFVAHCIFVRCYFYFRKPKFWQFVVWIVVFACICIFIQFVKVSSLLKIFGVLYTFAMTAMVMFSFGIPKQLMIGSIIFFISDILMLRNFIYSETVVSHFFSLGSYYVAVMLIAVKIFFGFGEEVCESK